MAAANPTLEEVKKHLDKATEHLFPKSINTNGETAPVLEKPVKGPAAMANTLVALQAAVAALTEYIKRIEVTAENTTDHSNDTDLSHRIRITEDDEMMRNRKTLRENSCLSPQIKLGRNPG